MKSTTLLLLSTRHYSKLSWVKQHNHSDLYREHAKPNREIIKSIPPKLSGLWSCNLNTSKIMKLAITFVFTTITANITYTTKIIAQAKLHMQPKQQWYRKLIGTSEKHNWSSRPPTNMNYNFLKILWSYLQLYYSHLKMILQLTRSINVINASLSKTWTESDMPL